MSENESVFLESDHRRGRTGGSETIASNDYPQFEDVALPKKLKPGYLIEQDLDELLPIG